jgi:tetratricopeptide (TPR) repeat protein
LICLLSLTCGSLVYSAQDTLSKEQMYSLFTQANEAFKQANSARGPAQREALYDKAILFYERIVEQGKIQNPKLHYNLANAYFLKGNIGKAILNYRRAEKLDKGDLNIQKNLLFARSKRIDLVREQPEKRVLQTLFFWHYDFSLKVRFLLAIVSFAALCLCLSFIIWRGRTPSVTVITVIGAILAVSMLASVIIEVSQSPHDSGVITAKQVIAHQADWETSPPSFKEPLHAGTEFKLIEHRISGWIHIKLLDGSDGWIPDNAAELI